MKKSDICFIYSFVANFVSCISAKYYLNWFSFHIVTMKVIGVNFFETQCVCIVYSVCIKYGRTLHCWAWRVCCTNATCWMKPCMSPFLQWIFHQMSLLYTSCLQICMQPK